MITVLLLQTVTRQLQLWRFAHYSVISEQITSKIIIRICNTTNDAKTIKNYLLPQ